jgi:CheY-like chemotaxis protein
MGEISAKTLRVLMLGNPQGGEEFSRWMDEHARIDRVDSFEEAMDALHGQRYDLVISGASDLEPLESVQMNRQATAIFDSVNQGVCIVGQAGELLWANPKMLAFPEEVRERACQCCVETFHNAISGAKGGVTQTRGRRFSLTTQNNEYYEVTATPVLDRDEQVTQVAGVVLNTTEARRLQDKLDAIDRAGRELVSLDVEQFAKLNTQERLELLEDRILQCTHDLLHFDNFAILVLDRNQQKLEMLLSYGLPAEVQDIELCCGLEGSGISGYVASRGRSYICPDVTRDSRYVPGLRNARSSLTIPLQLHDEVVGVANFESTQAAAFSEDDRQFAEIFGRYIALALHILELLVTERYTTTGQIGHDVMAEITAPLNDILSEVERLVEDYIGIDDLRHRLRAVSENAVQIRKAIQSVMSAKPGLIGARNASSQAKADPLLANKRVLVAEDEEIIRETITEVLGSMGCHVVPAEDGPAALLALGEGSFDLVLSDIKMPGATGYEVFAAAKERNSETPVILMTGFGYDPNHSIVRARREGLAAVLFKPFKVEQLLSEIRVALAPSEG